MKHIAIILSLLVGLAVTAPTSKESDDDNLVITPELFPESFVVYTSKHDIVNILVPLNALNFDEDSDDDTDDSDEAVIFFVEADENNGVRDYKGLYVLRNRTATKLLESGTDASAANDDTKIVYFGAKDGLYIYNAKEKKAEKYGTVTDSIIGIAKTNGTDEIFILTEQHELFKVTNEGTKKEKIDNVNNAQQIVLDYSNNLYYYAADKQPYVVSADGVKKIQGLPENPSRINLLKPPFVIEDGVPVVIDDKAYIIYANGSSEFGDIEFKVWPSAYSMEATLIQYYGYEKKIYEYNILTLILSEFLDEIAEYLKNQKDEIQSIATRSRNDLKP